MNIRHYWEDNNNRNEYRNKYWDDDDDDIIINRSMSEKIKYMITPIDPTNIMIINESATQIVNMSNQIDTVDNVLYLYGAPLLIFFCVISIAVNIKVLVSVFWIRRPISPTLYISLSLAGNIIFFIFNNNIFFT